MELAFYGLRPARQPAVSRAARPPTGKNLPEIQYCNPSGPMVIWNYYALGVVPMKILIADDNLHIRQVLRP